MSEPAMLSPEQIAARNRRNLWLALSLGAFVLLVFAITVAKMSAAP